VGLAVLFMAARVTRHRQSPPRLGNPPPGLTLIGMNLVDPHPTRHRDPRWVVGFTRLAHPALCRWFRAEVRELGRIPEGPALYVANHNGGFMTPDTWLFAGAVLRQLGIEHLPFGLAHDTLMRMPVLRWALRRIGGVTAHPLNAHGLFRDGAKVLVYPGGDIEAFRPSRQRHRILFGGRRGYVRLALREGVPIIPVVSAGAHSGWYVVSDGKWLAKRLRVHRVLRTDVLPITVSIPWGLTVGAPPYIPLPTRVLVEVLDPIRFDRSGPEAADDAPYVEACHQRVVGAMQAALDRLAQERRWLRRWRLAA
jgi:1-acyl-sn-glycerol-3-phosphate acyltransferase